jgi:hypothetical protein
MNGEWIRFDFLFRLKQMVEAILVGSPVRQPIRPKITE